MFHGLTYLMFINHNYRYKLPNNTHICNNSYEPDELQRHWLMYLCSNM